MDIAQLYNLYTEHSNVCTDTRNLISNSIFFALRGNNFNGNNFANKALTVCDYAVVDDPKVVQSEKYILVDNVLETLQNLALFHRKRLNIPVIAITGTNGKTTTKELVTKVLEQRYKVKSTRGNYNNHIGVPLTVLTITPDTQLAVIEMGASKIGDIKELCEIALPTHGIITNVGKAHLEGFESFENILKTKGELYNYLYENNGVAFVNYDNEYLEDMNPPRKTIHYGVSRFTHCQGILVDEIPFVSFRWVSTGEMVYDDADINWSSEDRYIKLKLVGKYNFENALAAVCVGTFFNIDDAEIKTALEAYQPLNNRSQHMQTEKNQLIVDCYNANPTSMKLSIESLLKFPNEPKVLILGDMLELGKVSSREHDVLIHWISELEGVSSVCFVGAQFYELKRDMSNAMWFASVVELHKFLSEQPISKSIILLKGSRGVKLEEVLGLL